VICHNRRRKAFAQKKEAQQYVAQKTNNENEENIRRYKNPLFETDKGGGTRKVSLTELHEIDIEKYEKTNQSPQKLLFRSESPSDSNNDWKMASALAEKTTKKKDINIELSRSRTRRRSGDRDLTKEFIEISRTLEAELGGVGAEREVIV
jgi:hypothetical protein